MAKAEQIPMENPDFTAMRTTQRTLLVDIVPEDADLTRFEAYGGLVYVYNFWELRVLGNGDGMSGYRRVKDSIAQEERSVLELAMDLDRPLEDELIDASSDGGDVGKVVMTLTTRKDPYTLVDRTWEVELPEEDGYIFSRRQSRTY